MNHCGPEKGRFFVGDQSYCGSYFRFLVDLLSAAAGSFDGVTNFAFGATDFVFFVDV